MGDLTTPMLALALAGLGDDLDVSDLPLGNASPALTAALSSGTTVTPAATTNCAAYCPLVPLPNSWLASMGFSCSACLPGYAVPAVDTSDVSTLPLTSASDANLAIMNSGITAAVTLACPTGWTCTIMAGIPDPFVYGGMAALAIAALMLLKGLAK